MLYLSVSYTTSVPRLLDSQSTSCTKEAVVAGSSATTAAAADCQIDYYMKVIYCSFTAVP